VIRATSNVRADGIRPQLDGIISNFWTPFFECRFFLNAVF